MKAPSHPESHVSLRHTVSSLRVLFCNIPAVPAFP
jgi:hypothetical protein